MPHQTHDAFPTLSDADLVTTTGGFDISGIMGMIGQAVGPKGQEIMGKIAPIAQSIMGAFGGMGGGGGGAAAG